MMSGETIFNQRSNRWTVSLSERNGSLLIDTNDLNAEILKRDTGLEIDLFHSLHVDFDLGGNPID